MAREFNIKTVTSTESITDLHVTVTTTFQDLLEGFTYTELLESESLFVLLSDSNIVAEDENGDSISGSTITSLEREKLEGIEAGATADQSDLEIKTAYENNADTNEFSDSDKTNLSNQSGTNTGDEPSASTTVEGVVERATNAEAAAGTDTTRYITPKQLADNSGGGSGDMLKSTYGPTNVGADVYEYENFKGVLQIMANIITPSTLIADQDDYNPTGFSTANMMRLNLAGDRVITGFEAPPAGVDRVFYFQNISNSKLKLKNNDSSSTAANRILNKDYGEKSFKKGEGGAYRYDHTSSRWRPYTRIG